MSGCANDPDDPLGQGTRTCEVAAVEDDVCSESASETVGCDAPAVDVHRLLAEMTDLRRLAQRSCPRYATYEASSRDRASVSPAATSDSLTGWFANWDWGNYLRAESNSGRTEHVMLDVTGPGAIVKLWTANGAGTLRVYLDGSTEPVIEADFEDLLSGRVRPWSPPFALVNSTGKNLDFPIPFQHHAKVTIEGEWWVYYYQIIYRLYEPGTHVTTFTTEQVSEHDLDAVAERLRRPERAADATSSLESCIRAPEQALTIPAATGGSEITEILLAPNDRSTRALRETVLSLTFDGRETTRVPLGDFFGAGPGFRPHTSLPLEVTPDGVFVSRFVMPFECSAVVRVTGPPDQTTRLSVRHHAAPFTAQTYHFHAHWAARGPLPTRPFRDVRLADIEGEGSYVGTMLAMDSRVDEWWGEGDEKIRVDGESFPSWFGTGTEDYFGYANAKREPFEHPYRGLFKTGSAPGQVANARFHVLDAIPFRSALVFDLELIHWNEETTVFFDTMTYFYAAPAASNRLPQAQPTEFRVP
jgi:hypothetical protein